MFCTCSNQCSIHMAGGAGRRPPSRFEARSAAGGTSAGAALSDLAASFLTAASGGAGSLPPVPPPVPLPPVLLPPVPGPPFPPLPASRRGAPPEPPSPDSPPVPAFEPTWVPPAHAGRRKATPKTSEFLLIMACFTDVVPRMILDFVP